MDEANVNVPHEVVTEYGGPDWAAPPDVEEPPHAAAANPATVATVRTRRLLRMLHYSLRRARCWNRYQKRSLSRGALSSAGAGPEPPGLVHQEPATHIDGGTCDVSCVIG